MEIINFFDSDDKEYWLGKIAQSDWGAGEYLAYLLKENKLFELIGENSMALLLTDEEKLVSFCTLAKYDDVQPTSLMPWIGFIYTFPEYRGNHFAGKLLACAEEIARQNGAAYTHISTNHVGLYEKYGYEFFTSAKDVEGEETRVYRKPL